MDGTAQQNRLPSRDDQPRNEPAVGLVATETNADHVVGEILRARRHGHDAVVTAQTACDALDFARELDATVVEPPEDRTTADDPRTRLATVAREKGYPGLMYHPDPGRRIDYAESDRAFAGTERFAIEAPTESAVAQEPTVLVGIPAYNEGATVGPVVEAALEYADDVLVVDDGSDDDTDSRARDAGATVVRHETNRGYGAALKTIFEQADSCWADHLVILDADGQHDANDIPDLVETQRETGADIVIGCRFGPEASTSMPAYRRLGLGVVNVLTNLSLGIVRSESRIRDTQSGFRAYSRRAIESLAAGDDIGDYMDASTDVLYHAHHEGYDIVEVPTTIDYEVEDGSSRNPLQHGIVLVMNIVRTVQRERPITILGVPGVACLLLGLGIAYWAIYNFVRSNTFPVGLAIAASCLVIVGTLTAFTAIILHSLAVYRE